MICVSLGNIDYDTCSREIDSAELAEIRMDLLSFSPHQFKDLFSSGRKLIATFRPDEKFTDQEREQGLVLAIENGAAYVDIEYEANKSYREKLVKVANQNKCDVIISYHDFSNTPSLENLNHIVKESLDMGANVVKLAVMAQDKKDNTRVLSLYSGNTRLVAFCMGNEGKLSRVLCKYFGAEFTFAAMNKEQATAPGQLTREKIMYYLSMLNQL